MFLADPVSLPIIFPRKAAVHNTTVEMNINL